MASAPRQSLKSRFAHIRGYSAEIRQYFLLIVIPLIFSVLLFVTVNAVSTRELEARGNVTAERFHAQVTGIFRAVEMRASMLAGNEAFLTELSRADPDVSVICSSVSGQVSGSYIRRAYFICPKHDRIYAESVYVYDSLGVITNSILNIESEDFDGGIDSIPELRMEDGWHLLNYTNACPYYVLHIHDAEGAEAGVLLVSLDMSRFLRTLHNSNQDVTFFCLYDGETSLTSLLLAQPEVDWDSDRAVSSLLDKGVRCFRVEEDGFRYLIAIEMRQYYAPLYAIGGLFGGYIVLVVVLGGFHLLRISRRRYEMLAELVDEMPVTGGGNPTTAEILRSIKRSLGNYRDMSQQYEQIILIRNLRHFLLTSADSATDEQTLNSFGLTGRYGGFCVVQFVVFNTDITAPHKIALEVTSLILSSALSNLGEDRFQAGVTDVPHCYCAVICLPEEFYHDAQFREIMDETLRLCTDSYGIVMRAAVSGYRRDFRDVSAAYAETRDIAATAKSIGSTARVLFSGDLTDASGIAVSGDFLKSMQILSNILVTENFDLVPTTVDTILREHLAVRCGDLGVRRVRMQCLSGLLAEAVLASLPEQEAAVYTRALYDAETPSALMAAVNEAFPNVVKPSVEHATDETIEQARAFIHDHIFNSDLSVADVAEHVNVSVQYLSRLFRRKLDITLLEYINSYRIECAKRALSETDDTILNIAEKVGFKSELTFRRNFRRYTGMAPSEYRTARRKERL